jgi:hypothetical protein
MPLHLAGHCGARAILEDVIEIKEKKEAVL